MQPHVHLRHLLSGAAQLGRKLFACCKAAVETEKLKGVHHRNLPIDLFRVPGGEIFQLCHDVNHLDRGRRGGVGDAGALCGREWPVLGDG